MQEKKIEIEKVDLPLYKEEDSHFKKIDCPSCQTQVPVKNIDLLSKIGKCTECDAIFSVKKEILSLQKVEIAKEKIPRPAGVDAYHFSNELEMEIEQPFPVLDTMILTLLPTIYIFVALVYFAKGITPNLTVAVISLLLMAKSIYRIVRRKQYKTHISIHGDSVVIKHRPKGTNKDQEYLISDIEQIFVKQGGDGAALYFVLNGADGQLHKKVLGRIKNSIHLKYIEQEIEDYLGIKNRTIAGEI